MTPEEVTTLLLSNEHLQSRLVEEDEVARLRSLIGVFADEIHILVYLRRQDRVAVSHYSTRLKIGADPVGPIFPLPAAGGALPSYFDYDAMLRRYEAVFGAENISVQILEPARLLGGELLCDFRARCGLASSPDYVEPARQNLSLSELGLRFYQRFNSSVPRFVADRVNPYRQGIDEAVSKVSIGPGPQARREDAEAFYRGFEAGNRAINARVLRRRCQPRSSTPISRCMTPTRTVRSRRNRSSISPPIFGWSDRGMWSNCASRTRSCGFRFPPGCIRMSLCPSCRSRPSMEHARSI